MKQQTRQRTMSVKIDIPATGWAVYRRLKDLSWQAASRRNTHLTALYMETLSRRHEGMNLGTSGIVRAADKTELQRLARKDKDGWPDLSGAAYAQAEQEVAGIWANKTIRNRILAGGPLADYMSRPTGGGKHHLPPLSVSGKTKRETSGIILEAEDGRYVAYMNLQRDGCENDAPSYKRKRGAFVLEPGGGWFRIVLTKNAGRDERYGPVLDQFLDWSLRPGRAAIRIMEGKSEAFLLMSYESEVWVPEAGERVATLGPVDVDGRLLLRTEQMGRDVHGYQMDLTAWRSGLITTLGQWELIRRRAAAQIGHRKGHARRKRQLLARLSPDEAIKNALHQKSLEIAKWCNRSGVGTIHVVGLSTGDWPAARFEQMLKYKAADQGIVLDDKASLSDESTDRAAKAGLKKQAAKAGRLRKAVREIQHQLDRRTA